MENDGFGDVPSVINFTKMNALFEVLAQHKAIAWDLDETLIASAASIYLHGFILDHPEIKHAIVTFRTHGMEDDIWDDLSEYPLAPKQTVFLRHHNPSDDQYMRYSEDDNRRSAGNLVGPLTVNENIYLNWKGDICKEFGYTVLIDDRTAEVILGCVANGIVLYHPLDFIE